MEERFHAHLFCHFGLGRIDDFFCCEPFPRTAVFCWETRNCFDATEKRIFVTLTKEIFCCQLPVGHITIPRDASHIFFFVMLLSSVQIDLRTNKNNPDKCTGICGK